MRCFNLVKIDLDVKKLLFLLGGGFSGVDCITTHLSWFEVGGGGSTRGNIVHKLLEGWIYYVPATYSVYTNTARFR